MLCRDELFIHLADLPGIASLGLPSTAVIFGHFGVFELIMIACCGVGRPYFLGGAVSCVWAYKVLVLWDTQVILAKKKSFHPNICNVVLI